MSVEEFGIDRDDIKYVIFKKYQGKKDQTDRVGIVFEDPKKAFIGVKCYFHTRYFLAKDTADFKALVYPKLGEPTWRLGVVLVKYVVNHEGKLSSYELVPWLFKEKMYQTLKNINKEFPLDAHDLSLTCDNEQYQNIRVTSCKESWWRKSDKLKQRILAEAKPHAEAIRKNLASDLSIEEIREILGMEVPGSQDAATDVDLGSVADMV